MTNDTPNALTLRSYDQNAERYVEGTSQEVSEGVKKWLEAALRELPCAARIFEIGSAFGCDAAAMQARGHRVACSDATPAFVALLQEKGFDARRFDALGDPLPDAPYDLIYANAVLLHFEREALGPLLGKIHAALNPGGRFAFSLKQGEGEAWVEAKRMLPRYFCYWRQDAVERELAQAGFARWTVDDDPTGHGGDAWLRFIAFKAI